MPMGSQSSLLWHKQNNNQDGHNSLWSRDATPCREAYRGRALLWRPLLLHRQVFLCSGSWHQRNANGDAPTLLQFPVVLIENGR